MGAFAHQAMRSDATFDDSRAGGALVHRTLPLDTTLGLSYGQVGGCEGCVRMAASWALRRK